MKPREMIGIAFSVFGLVMVTLRHRAAAATLALFSDTAAGRAPDLTTWILIIGAVAAVGGSLYALHGHRSP